MYDGFDLCYEYDCALVLFFGFLALALPLALLYYFSYNVARAISYMWLQVNASAGDEDSDSLAPCLNTDQPETEVTLSPTHGTTGEDVYTNDAAIEANLLDHEPPQYNDIVLTIQPAQEPPPYHSLCEVPHYSSEDKTVDQRLIDLS